MIDQPSAINHPRFPARRLHAAPPSTAEPTPKRTAVDGSGTAWNVTVAIRSPALIT